MFNISENDWSAWRRSENSPTSGPLIGVEFARGLPDRPGSRQRHFLQAPEDFSVRDVLIHTAR